MTETDPAQRFTLGTRTTLKAIIFFGPVSNHSNHPNGSFGHRLGKLGTTKYNGPTHPPQHLGAFDHLLFPLPSSLFPWPPLNQAFMASHSDRPASTGFIPCFAAYETTCAPSPTLLLYNSRQRHLQHITHPHNKSPEKRGLQARYHSLSCA